MMSLPTKVRGTLFGGGFGLLAYAVFSLTKDLAATFGSANLIYASSVLAVCIPAVAASIVNWSLFPAFSVCYWALIGWLACCFQRRRKLFLLLLVALHLVVLFAVDLVTQSIPIFP